MDGSCLRPKKSYPVSYSGTNTLSVSLLFSLYEYIRPRLHTAGPLDDTMLTRAVLDRALPIQWDICRSRSSRLPPQKRRARCVDIALRTFSQKYCNMVRCECQEKANREGIYMTESMHICWNRRTHFGRNIDTRHFPKGRTGKAIA